MTTIYTVSKNEKIESLDDQNDALRAQVDAELPRPVGGFETELEEDEWRRQQEQRFIQLVQSKE
jgi:hypothetical protein